jgi:hypothetical protein
MEQYVVAARLKPGKAAEAERELAAGPPFDPAATRLSSHSAYLSERYVYLLFEGEAARGTALRLAHEHLAEVGRWQSLVMELPSSVDAVPPDARCVYRWQAGDSAQS